MRKISISSFADEGWWNWSKADAPRNIPIFGFIDESWGNWSKCDALRKSQVPDSLTKAEETDRRNNPIFSFIDEGWWNWSKAEAMRKISISASFADDGWWNWSKADAPRKQFLASLTKANETDRRLMSRAQEENPSIRASQLLASQSMESGPRSEQHRCNEVVSVETWYSWNWLIWLMVMFLPLEGC